MRKGCLYLVPTADWFTRKVPVWRVFDTWKADVCLEAINEAIYKFAPSEIMKTDKAASSPLATGPTG